ncbi:anaerobic sulfite reductase subunit C, partial [Clostridium magnum DSM 2767]
PLGKEHIGYIIDRTGYQEYKKWALKDVSLGNKVEIKDNIYW